MKKNLYTKLVLIMMGSYVRDKDAVTASMMICEMAAWYNAQGNTLLQALEALYEKYGYYAEKTLNLVMNFSLPGPFICSTVAPWR